MTEKVKIGPKISKALNKRLAIYSINTGIHKEVVIEMALSQFLQDKDLTPVVQLQLDMALEVSYDDPRFESIKALIQLARTTTANEHGKRLLVKRLTSAYNEARNSVGMCPEIKMEYEEAITMLQEAMR